MSRQNIIINDSVMRQLIEAGYTKEQSVLAIQATNLFGDCQNLNQYLAIAKSNYQDLYQMVHAKDQTNQSFNNSQYQQTIPNYYDMGNSTKRKTKIPSIPVGLVNIGNLCYFNSLLQLMLNNPIFVKTIFDYKVQYNNDKFDNFLNSLQRLFANLIISNSIYYDASEVIQFMWWDSKDIQLVGHQQDFRELCELFLSKVDQSLKEKEQSSSQNQLNLNINDCFKSQILKQQFVLTNERDRYQIFIPANLSYGNIYNTLYHEFGQQKLTSIPENLFFQISRYSYNRNTQNMVKSTQDFNLHSEIYIDFIIQDVNQVHNLFEIFNGATNGSQQMNLDPQQIQKYIASFKDIIEYYSLLQNEIMVQQLTLDQDILKIQQQSSEYQQRRGDYQWLNQQLSQCCSKKYYLHSIVIHLGNANQGHYFIYIYNFSKKQWFQYNDSIVEVISESEVMRLSKNNAYIVTYVSEQQRQLIRQQEEIVELIQQNDLSNDLYENLELLQMIPQNLFKEIYQQNLNLTI
ncbi:unnamed protein product (macronuclear) [Paramecium tetraurelia]|uniref:Ubiquitin carboxyl-terminal hydrolase n=1 Tax=Paramecium tetraurelia TaxID=5888 RepID=A0DH57_PARTE|nr:uncharacterized protein GSPATT00016760001 [Paramecium tetraurelia]CAK82374.1 unnamed protein product [Paramecium tetraurelia]|eukprot:XP_001449771.1 hypothetical protein (macronuclear) [Paramecium tetraurelia strain d4-2]